MSNPQHMNGNAAPQAVVEELASRRAAKIVGKPEGQRAAPRPAVNPTNPGAIQIDPESVDGVMNSLIIQRNNAMNQVAVVEGNLFVANNKLRVANETIEALTAELDAIRAELGNGKQGEASAGDPTTQTGAGDASGAPIAESA